MNLAGMSPEKAPPLEAPLGLFYLMPLFLGLAGMVLACQGDQVLLSRWTPAALAATHFVVLGVLAPVMCGAMLQISPVLLGAPYPRVRLVARLTGSGLALGSLLIGSGFLFSLPGLLLFGGVVAASGLVVFLIGSYLALATAGGRRATLQSVRLAVLALGVTVLLGLSLALSRFGWLALDDHLRWVDSHVAWGLAGWVGLLLTGIGMELIPLFYIAPPFGTWLRRGLPVSVLGLLLLLTVLGLFPQAALAAPQWVVLGLFAAYLVYSAVALWVEQRRQRPQRDANLWLWQGGHVTVFVAFALWLAGGPQSLVGVLLLGGSLSFVIGSLLKIVPFLSWLDLQQRRAAGRHLHVGLPRLRMLLPVGSANAIAATLGGAILAALAGGLLPPLAQVGGALLVACASLLAHALLRAARLRRGVIRQFDLPPAAGTS